jgi:hypothetical protein
MGKGAEVRALRLAAHQLGLITTAQCEQLGLSRHAVWRRIASGAWTRIHQGVLRASPGAIGFDQRELAVLLRAGEGAALSHTSAARRLGLEVPRSAMIHVMVPYDRSCAGEIAGARVWKSRDLRPEEITTRGPFRITRVGRTLVDLSALLEERWLSACLDSALRRSTKNLGWVKGVLETIGRGHRGTGVLRELLDRAASEGVIPDSVLESFASHLGFVSGRLPVWHHRVIDVRGGFVAEVDLAWPEIRMAVELEGWRWHAARRQAFEAGCLRQRRLDLSGWHVHRFVWSDVVLRPVEMVAQLNELYELRRVELGAPR